MGNNKYLVDICKFSNWNVVMLPKSLSQHTRPIRKQTICISEELFDTLTNEKTTLVEATELWERYRETLYKIDLSNNN